MMVLEGHANAIERGTAFFLWRQVLPILVELLGKEIDTASALASVAKDAGISEVFLPLLRIIFACAPSENPITTAMNVENRSVNTEIVLVILLRHLLDHFGPVLLLVEDTQWLDSASLKLLNRIKLEVSKIFGP